MGGGPAVSGGPAVGGGPTPSGGFAAAAVLVNTASVQAMKNGARLSLETPLRRTRLKAKMRVPLIGQYARTGPNLCGQSSRPAAKQGWKQGVFGNL